ncbi:MAG: CPBP family intramembrane metalloprotease, partial [Candidatus Obscuribacterales bacterium]|nr:CPBP family intramembrane metalloprotease [Candidatus Obscuribacterales bacterium]
MVAALWMNVAKIDLLPHFRFVAAPFLWGIATAAGSVSITLISITLGKRIPFFAELKKMSDQYLAPLLALLGAGDIIFLSLLSGFAEEVFFRGLMQAQCGIFASSIAFGFFHDPTLKQRSYIIFACVAGLLLGFVYEKTGNLWTCITAHSLHNLVTMLAL